MADLSVTSWLSSSTETPSDAAARDALIAQGMQPMTWWYAAHDTWPTSTFNYNRVIYVTNGDIAINCYTTGDPKKPQQFSVAAGQAITIPAGVSHDAKAGPHGVNGDEGHQ